MTIDPILVELTADVLKVVLGVLFDVPPPPSTTPLSTHWLYDLRDIHDKLVHSFLNRQIYPFEGFVVSTHKLSCPALPPRSLLFKPMPPRP